MRLSYSTILTSLIILFLFSCKQSGRVTLIDTNCSGEIPQKTNLKFIFSKDLISDSLLAAGGWQSEKYIRFIPEVEGFYRWENSQTLVFSPANGFSPATSFTAEISSEVCKFTKYQLGKIPILKFHTPPQKLENLTAQWTAFNPADKGIGLLAELHFTYPQPANELQKWITLRLNGQETSFTVVNPETENEKKCVLAVKGIQPEDKEFVIDIEIKEGLLPHGGKNPTTEPIRTTFALASPLVLQITKIEAIHDGVEGVVKLFTSQKIVNDQLKSLIKISPSLNFNVQATDEGIQISSAGFLPTQTYEISVLQGLKGVVGSELKEKYKSSIMFGELEPAISFCDKNAHYLSAKGNKNIMVNIVNVPKVKLTVRKIYESNILPALRYGAGESYYDDYYDTEDVTYSVSDVVYEEEIATARLPKKGASHLLNFNLRERLSEYKGIYHISLYSASDYWINDSRIVSLSDLGIIARETENFLTVFINSISTAKQVEGVECRVFGTNNQLIGQAKTDNNGMAFIELKKESAPGFKPSLITVATSKDFNYLSLRDARVETSRFDVGGKSISSSKLDAFIYGERDMYRPGEKINLSAIVRTSDWKKPGEIPVKIKFSLPNGMEFKSLKKLLNEQGSCEVSFELPEQAVTGSYLFQLFTANDVLLGSKTILVEDFMPDRIKVATHLEREHMTLKDTLMLRGSAQNLFGTPAAGRNYEVELQLHRENFHSKKFPQYNFDLSFYKSYIESIVRQGITDEAGDFYEKFSLPQTLLNQGIVAAKLFTTVFDETGRPVNRFHSATVFTQKVFLGISQSDYYYQPLHQNISFGIIALNHSDELTTARARVQLIKYDYKTVLSKSWDYFRYESQVEEKILVEKNLDISGTNTVFNFVPKTPGEYEIRVFLPDAKSYVKQRFYSYGGAGAGFSNFEVNREGHIDIALDKAAYQSGEKAKLLFKTPFNGKMLVTVERDEIMEKFYLDVQNRSATATLQLRDKYLPNVYVTATLFKPHAESDLPLTVAHGFKNISVSETSRKINLQILAPEKIRSNSHQKITVRGAPNSFITFAAVDEGILQITDYKTPDPYAHFYSKRALQVNSYDMYANLFPEVKSTLTSVGGDGFDLSKRVNPITSKRVKLVRYWSGIQKTNADGTAIFEFDVPSFSGELRLMAVNYVNEKFGAAEKFMKVADPIVISSAIPRFLSPGDEALVALTLSNTTSQLKNVRVNIETEGPVQVRALSAQSVSIAPNRESRIEYKLLADPKIGGGKVTVTAVSGNEKFNESTEISVRPIASLYKVFSNGEVNAGETRKITLPTSGFIKGTENYSLIVSHSPLVQLGENLTNLLRYPHGCTEQIVAAAFPQIYFADLCQAIGFRPSVSAGVSYNVSEAIKKIKLRQLFTGGVSLWDNQTEDHWWASAFATHFLIEAKQNGYEVDDNCLDKLLSFLQTKLRKKELLPYYYNGGKYKMLAAREIPYSLFVLSLAGKPQFGTMNYYKSNQQLLTEDGKFLLAAAFALGGDRAMIYQLQPNVFEQQISDKDVTSHFASDLRDEAIALDVLIHVQPENNQIPVMAKHVAEKLSSRKYLSTQELVFSLNALGKLSKKNISKNITAKLKVNGKPILEMKNNSIKLTSSQLTSGEAEITASGEGKAYYFLEASGISATGKIEEKDNYLRVRRTFYDRYGRPITDFSFKQNDLIIVEISLDNSFRQIIQNVVITDLLPAGFEIENPRVKEIPGLSWIKNESQPMHTDIRDDRINLFVNAGSNTQYYYYAVRAVSPGKYQLGILSADAMYAGEYHSYSGSGIVTITPH
jgi:uncharacterized protein YfaS (alpha-2-macroglobulin family)